ncbi:1601_t:CDS:2, partial [Ambispora leptoticha]
EAIASLQLQEQKFDSDMTNETEKIDLKPRATAPKPSPTAIGNSTFSNPNPGNNPQVPNKPITLPIHSPVFTTGGFTTTVFTTSTNPPNVQSTTQTSNGDISPTTTSNNANNFLIIDSYSEIILIMTWSFGYIISIILA